MGQSDLEDKLDEQLRSGDRIPGAYVRQYKFAAHLKRRWAADFCWPAHMLLVEVDGGTWNGGRHTTGIGYHKDLEKLNRATLLGYRALRFDSTMVKDGTAIAVIEEWFEASGLGTIAEPLPSSDQG